MAHQIVIHIMDKGLKNFIIPILIDIRTKHYNKLFLLHCFFFLIVSCSGQDTERLKTLENIKMNITARDLPFNDRYHARVLEFNNVSNNDTSKIRIIATIFKNYDCAITVSPFEYVSKQTIQTFRTIPEQSSGYALSYDEQIAMLLKVIHTCKNKYSVRDFVFLRVYLETMGDFNVYFTEQYDSLIKTKEHTDKYELLHTVLEQSYLLDDIKLVLKDYNVIHDIETPYVNPKQISYTQFSSNNKLGKQYTQNYVYSGVFAEFRIKKKE